MTLGTLGLATGMMTASGWLADNAAHRGATDGREYLNRYTAKLWWLLDHGQNFSGESVNRLWPDGSAITSLTGHEPGPCYRPAKFLGACVGCCRSLSIGKLLRSTLESLLWETPRVSWLYSRVRNHSSCLSSLKIRTFKLSWKFQRLANKDQ
jgi:hypothetical protein